jgi:hypothetical protein
MSVLGKAGSAVFPFGGGGVSLFSDMTNTLGLGSQATPQRNAPPPGSQSVAPASFPSGPSGATAQTPTSSQQDAYPAPSTNSSPILGNLAASYPYLFQPSSGLDTRGRTGGFNVGV